MKQRPVGSQGYYTHSGDLARHYRQTTTAAAPRAAEVAPGCAEVRLGVLWRMRLPWGTLILAPVLLMLSFTLGCSSPGTALPPIVEGSSARPIPGKFVWHNLITSDAEAARRFYGELFDWEFELKDGGRYSVISHRGRNVGGILDTTETGEVPKRAHWLSAVSVADLDESLKAVTAAGGKQLEEAIEVGGIGRVVTVADADGAPFDLVAQRGDDVVLVFFRGDW